jgi:hypothetical protein
MIIINYDLLLLLLRYLRIVVRLLGGGGINNIELSHDLTSRPRLATGFETF